MMSDGGDYYGVVVLIFVDVLFVLMWFGVVFMVFFI